MWKMLQYHGTLFQFLVLWNGGKKTVDSIDWFRYFTFVFNMKKEYKLFLMLLPSRKWQVVWLKTSSRWNQENTDLQMECKE